MKKMTYDTVYKLGLALPGAEESTSYGARSLKVNGKMFACPAINKSAEPNSLAIRIDMAQRDELIEADPETYYVTDHYVDYPCVLIRLSRVQPDALRDLLRMAHEYVVTKANKPARRRQPAGAPRVRRRPT